MENGFESDLYEEDVSADSMADVGEDGFEDTFTDGFEEDVFEEEGSLEDGFESDAMAEDTDAWDEGIDAFASGEGADELEQAFAEAMDAGDEDEFLRRLLSGVRRVGAAASPVMRRIGRRALPIATRLLRQGARQIGGVAGQEVGGALGGGLGSLLQGGLGALLGGGEQVDAMDAFADLAADEVLSEDEMEEFTPVLAGLAGRYIVRNVITPAARAARPAMARALGRAVTRATTQATRTIVRRQGPAAVRAVPRVVRRVAVLARQQGASPRTIPQMVQRTAARVAQSPRAAARLARPSQAARRMRARAGVRPGVAARTGAAAMRPMGARTARSIVLRGPARISIQPM